MKKKVYLFTLVLISALFFNAPKAKALDCPPSSQTVYRDGSSNYGSSYNTGCNNTTPRSGNGAVIPPSSSAKLPINNGVAFLFIAGLAIGVTTLKKVKTISPALVKA